MSRFPDEIWAYEKHNRFWAISWRSKSNRYVRGDIADTMLEALELAYHKWGGWECPEVQVIYDTIAKAKGEEKSKEK